MAQIFLAYVNKLFNFFLDMVKVEVQLQAHKIVNLELVLVVVPQKIQPSSETEMTGWRTPNAMGAGSVPASLASAMVVSTILTLPFAFGGGMSELAQPEVLGLIVFVGILSSAFPFSLEMEAMRRLPSNVFGVFMSLEPAIAAMIGFLVLDQGVAPRELVAIALVVTASAGALRSAGVPEPIDH